jgi:hypothetical protein
VRPVTAEIERGRRALAELDASFDLMVRAVWVVASPRVAYLPDAVVAVGVGGAFFA